MRLREIEREGEIKGDEEERGEKEAEAVARLILSGLGTGASGSSGSSSLEQRPCRGVATERGQGRPGTFCSEPPGRFSFILFQSFSYSIFCI